MDPAEPQQMLLSDLLEAHPRLLEASTLCARHKRYPNVEGSLKVLVQDGLATRLGDLVGASRAAVRFEALRGELGRQ